ncbi:purine-cytosine permease family protein [Neobacillus kokaensis]|uniref:Purine-cytosine permease YxlA n=1 Tax=Neobacillus kokaensis TaxID=2759023 RepID=A0ABQ3N526_9BACI|nr:cytosine permease [Neobacillus kokaensis]GHH99201.1 putative purine-cytosine permease YxlA [Neobacillus kokaensis]
MADQHSNSIEQKSYEYIPLEERRGKPKELFFTWYAANTVSTTLVTGALAIVIGLNFWWAALSIILGHALGATVMALHSAQGPKLGIPQVMQSRAQFGYFGVILPMLIVFIMYMGYGASNTVLVGQGINETLGINVNGTVLVSLIPMVLLAIYGQGLIQKSMKIYTIVYTIIFIILTFLVLTNISMEMLNRGGFSFSHFLLATSISITWQITYGPYVSDHSRYMHPKESKKTFAYSYLGSFLSSTWLMLLGAAIATMVVDGNVMGQIKELGGGLGTVIVILLSLGLIVINSLNIYGAGIILLSIASNFVKFTTTIKIRVLASLLVGVLLALAATVGAGNFMGYFQLYLGFILFFIVPWSVINLTDFYLLKRQNFKPEDFVEKNGIFGKLRRSSIIIYLITVISQIPFTNTGIYQGPVSKMMGGLDIAWVIGIILSLCLYLGYEKMKKRTYITSTSETSV